MQHRTLRAGLPALALLLASAFVGYASAEPPQGPTDKDDRPNGPKVVIKTEYFCCDSVDPGGNDGAGTGQGCVKTTEDNINGCRFWLACPGGATGSDGTTTCTNPKQD
jgi:hypothetical protein